ncbi:hypothetical protein MMC11_005072 [Xylographa trunciseda]|nr:hypothetical protein [Xylographa trunciseda]
MENRSGEIQATCISMVVLCTVAIGLRFLSRSLSRHAGYGWDDWTALAAYPFVIGLSALSFYWISIGLGQHEDQVSTPITALLIPLFAFNFIFNTALALIKASVLLFYARIFKVVRWFSILLWTVGALIIGWYIMTQLLATFSCTPVAKAWNPKLPGTCVPTYTSFMVASVPNTITDWFLLLLPLPMLWGLQIDLRRKIGLVAVFVCGYCVVVISIIRLVSLVKAGTTLDEDLTWNIVTTHVYTVLEPSIALISTCLPSIFHLGKRVMHLYSPAHKDPSLPLSNASVLYMGRTGNPIDPAHPHGEGFVKLDDGHFEDRTSRERLFKKEADPGYHANAFPGPMWRQRSQQDEELGEQIHVRNTVEVV